MIIWWLNSLANIQVVYDLHTAGCTWLYKHSLKLIKGLYFFFWCTYMHLIVGRPRVHLPCDRRISMVTDDVHIVFAEKIKDMVNRLRHCTYKNTWQSSIVKPVGSCNLGWGNIPRCCLWPGCIYVSRQKIPLLREGNICLPSYDPNPKPIPRVRSLPRCRWARTRIGMGSSASIILPSQNDEPSAFIPRRLRATIGFPFPFSLSDIFCFLFSLFFPIFVFAPPPDHTYSLVAGKSGGPFIRGQKYEPVVSSVCLRYRRFYLVIQVLLT